MGNFSSKLTCKVDEPAAERLLEWYLLNKRALPWRQDRDPYRVLVSELMLQQTTVAAVIPLYERWMERFPTLESLAEAEQETVMQAWSGLGYYNRAARLHQTARLLCERGSYPSRLQDWLDLPGIGPYTAAAVVSIAFALPHLALDTNAIRVLYRYLGWQRRADHTASHQELRQRIETELGQRDFGLLNQALMELGATTCRVRQPLCATCPLAHDCLARSTGTAEAIPAHKPKPTLRQTLGRVTLLGAHPEHALLPQGTSVGLLSHLYQPLIDIEEENRQDWPLTPWLERLRDHPRLSPKLGTVRHGISGRNLVLEIHSLLCPALTQEMLDTAGQHSLPVLEVDRNSAAESNAALSTLTRKILRVWQESP